MNEIEIVAASLGKIVLLGKVVQKKMFKVVQRIDAYGSSKQIPCLLVFIHVSVLFKDLCGSAWQLMMHIGSEVFWDNTFMCIRIGKKYFPACECDCLSVYS